MPDVLTLGGLQFDDFSTPDSIGAGGKQAMVVHKLPGGQRVIDTLGPDESQISWSGKFFSNNAFLMVQALDAMRASGAVVPLMFAGLHRNVLVESFSYQIRRLHLWIEYNIACTVVQNASQGNLGNAGPASGQLAANDLNAAGNIAGLQDSTVTPDPSVFTTGTNPTPFLAPGTPGSTASAP